MSKEKEVAFPKGCRSDTGPVVIFHSFRLVFVSRERSHRFAEGSRRMFDNQLILSVDPPRSLEKLPEFNLNLRIRSCLSTRGEDRESILSAAPFGKMGIVRIPLNSLR